MPDKRAKKTSKQQEPVLVIKPASKMLGLDYLHISLVVLVIILVALLVAVSTFSKPTTYISCQGPITNGTCATPQHNSTQAVEAAERIIASYSLLNSSLSLLPYYSLPGNATASYLANQSEWLVVMPYRNPYALNTIQFSSLLIYDSNLTLARPFLQTSSPLITTQNRVISFGTVNIAGKTQCTSSTPLPVYGFFDIYAPGAIQGIEAAINASNQYKGAINMSYKVVFTGYAQKYYAGYGTNVTQTDGAYLWCASQQPSKFAAYVANFSLLFQGYPVQASTLQQVVIGSGLNATEFGNCIQNSPSALQGQAALANYYMINVSPSFVVNCKYQTIPQTLDSAVNYALNHTT